MGAYSWTLAIIVLHFLGLSEGVIKATHHMLNDTTMTYDTAREFCKRQGGDLCSQAQICVNGRPIKGVLKGDQWAPISDGYNDWVELGSEGGGARRLCWRHNEHYAAPAWGISVGACPPWSRVKTCEPKGNVFCCKEDFPSHHVLDYTTLTYQSARKFCLDQGADLCSREEICPNGVPIITGILPGDQWAPIRDGYNDWVEVGNDQDGRAGRICWRHNERYPSPGWGVSSGACHPWNRQKLCDIKGNVYCCGVANPLHHTLDDATMTYESARRLCTDQGRDLCSLEEICVNGDPVITGPLSGDQWAPISNGYNDWVEIGTENGNSPRLCWRHNAHYPAPRWGITTGSCPPWNRVKTCDPKGNVFCCLRKPSCPISVPTSLTMAFGSNGVSHHLLDHGTMTYDSARSFCINHGADLCSLEQICVNREPVIIGILSGDKWAPIRDGYNDWVEIGSEDGSAPRICWRHNQHYSAPPWGINTGSCPPWNTVKTCDLKGNVFCCRPSRSSSAVEPRVTPTPFLGTNNASHHVLNDRTMTYNSAQQFCRNRGRELCSLDQICEDGQPVITGIVTGDQWAPIRDGYNDWVELGREDGRARRLCWRHNAHYPAPPWGINTGSCPPWNRVKTCDPKGNVFCCPRVGPSHHVLDDATMTYNSAREYCRGRGKRLCSLAEICSNNVPVIVGILPGDQWAPIRDRYNDWVELGNEGGNAPRICWRHNAHYPAPPWGINTGSCPPWNRVKTCDPKGNVFCC